MCGTMLVETGSNQKVDPKMGGAKNTVGPHPPEFSQCKNSFDLELGDMGVLKVDTPNDIIRGHSHT